MRSSWESKLGIIDRCLMVSGLDTGWAVIGEASFQ